MIDRILSFLFVSIIVILFLLSYLEVPVVEGLDNGSRQLGKIEVIKEQLTKKVNDLLSVVKGTDMEKIKQYKVLDEMNIQVKENKRILKN